MTKPVLYLDLDGVLVDFVGGALKAHGQYIPAPDIKWDFYNQFDPPMSESDFWKPCGFDFWNGLRWAAEGKNFLAHMEKLFGDRIVILTSPCDTPGGVEGKVAWIRRELPLYAASRRFFIGSSKQLMAGPSKLLVDDNDGNVQKFEAEGGKTVLVPRSWNRRWYDTWADNGRFNPAAVALEVETVLGQMEAAL